MKLLLILLQLFGWLILIALAPIAGLYLLSLLFIALMAGLQQLSALIASFPLLYSTLSIIFLLSLVALAVIFFISSKKPKSSGPADYPAKEDDPFGFKRTSGPYGSEEGTYVW